MPLEFVTVIQSLVSPFLRLMAAVTTSAGTVEVELESELVESESTYPAKPFLFAVFESSEKAFATSAKLSFSKALSMLFFFFVSVSVKLFASLTSILMIETVLGLFSSQAFFTSSKCFVIYFLFISFSLTLVMQ